MKQDRISIDLLREFLSYDPEDGRITWKSATSKKSMKIKIGNEAGCINNQGYRVITIYGAQINAHRIAWALHFGHWPDCEIDHKNCKKSDNRIINLRKANPSLNQANIARKKKNTSGRKGVTWNKALSKWQAGIKVNGKQKHLGLFENLDDAHAAYVAAAEKAFKEFARTQ